MKHRTCIILGGLVLVILCGFNVANQFAYLRTGESKGHDWQILLERLSRLNEIAPPQSLIGLDVQDVALPNIEANFTRGHETWNLSGWFPYRPIPPGKYILAADHQKAAEINTAISLAKQRYQRSELKMGGCSYGINRYARSPAQLDPDGIVIAPAANGTILNASSPRPPTGFAYLKRAGELNNHLLQVDSPTSHIILPGVVENVALWQYENDNDNPGSGLQAAGRCLLFEVLNPVPNSRLLLDITVSGLPFTGAALPPVSIVSGQEIRANLVGNGAARVLSEPIFPLAIDGHYYFSIDFGTEARRFPNNRHGLLALYNSHLPLDPRWLVAFVRNISLLTPAQVSSLSTPDSVLGFPAGLFQPGLLFSGFYENGWMAEAARVRLHSSEESSSLEIRGQMPGRQSGERVSLAFKVLIDGTLAAERRLEPGDFEVRIPLRGASGPHWIELRADHTRQLSEEDHRLASVLLKSIAIKSTAGDASASTMHGTD